jgi:predicted ATPase/DNA-binding CsgD family transcriptional regulator
MIRELGRLSPRERQVAVLVRDGLTDRQIAEKLCITRRTAEWHVEQILAKLALASRAQIAAQIAQEEALGSLPADHAGVRGLQNVTFDQRPDAERRSVGRANEAAQLQAGFESATAAHGLLLCVTGEAGIGKTTLVEDFLAGLSATRHPHLVGRGRCSERLAGAEAYLPILEALESLVRGQAGRAVTRLMKRAAPLWYMQVIPKPTERSAGDSAPEVAPISQERLKREFVTFLQEVSQSRPLVLFIDDMHWADVSTVDLLGYTGAKLESLPVLIIATYRPSDLFPAKHPFSTVQLDLQTRGVCREVPVEFLSRHDIDSYLAIEFPGHRFSPSFSGVIHEKTEGNALFMVDMLRYLKAQRVIAEQQGHWALAEAVPAIEREVPESVRSMILRKIDQLEETDRTLLVGAAVQGYDFESAVIAHALKRDAGEVEERLSALDKLYGFVRPMGELEFPDTTLSVRYRFVHVLYQNAFYGSLGPTRRSSLSAAVAEALLSFHGEYVAAIASTLAFLFESARDSWRASGYYLLAVQNAGRVFAHNEEITLARRGLELLKTVPQTPERAERELNLQVALGLAVTFSRGYASAETKSETARTLALCEGMGNNPQIVPVWFALGPYYLTSADLTKAREIGERLLAIAEAAQDPVLFLGAHTIFGLAVQLQGEHLLSHQHLERAVALHDPRQIASYAAIYRTDPGMYARGGSIRNLYLLGYPDQAARRVGDTLLLARQGADRSSAGFPLTFAAFFYQFLGKAEKVLEVADECLALSREYGIPQEQAWVTTIRGWAAAESGHVDEGLAEIRAGLALQQSGGAVVAWPQFLAILADAARKAGRIEEALAAVAQGLEVAQKNGEHFYDAELYRLKGEFLIMQAAADVPEAERCFLTAIETARRQSAKALELRAAISLSRLRLEKERRDEVREILTGIYGWFTEGFDTPDLIAAKALLQKVS